MDDVICALCIKSCYHPKMPLQSKNIYSGKWDRTISTFSELKEAHAEGLSVFEFNNPMALGVYADTFVKGIALCAMHALYIVQTVDLATL